MGEPTRQPLSGVFVDRLLERVDPHNPSRSARMKRAQVLCGRWLALRRLQRRLTREQVAAALGLAADDLLIVEVGLARPPLALGRTWWLLACVLASDRRDAELVQAVLRLAHGEPGALAEGVLARVLSDLESDEMPH